MLVFRRELLPDILQWQILKFDCEGEMLARPSLGTARHSKNVLKPNAKIIRVAIVVVSM